MYLFTRRVHARAGNPGAAMAWATSITERVRQVTGLDISLFSGAYGPQVGTLVWSTFVPDLTALEAATDKTAVDEGMLEAIVQGQQFAPEGAHDRLLQLIHPAPEAIMADDAPASTYVGVVSSVCAPGSLARGIELGVEIAQKATEITGVPTAFLMDTTGPYGGVSWISAFADVSATEAANAALAASEEWVRLLDGQVPGVYTADPSLTQQLLYRRVL